MSSGITIRDVRTILTAPAGIDLVVVKVETSEPGLYGLGCATFTQRPLAVKTAVDEYLRPFAVGKDVQAIEDLWNSAHVSGYWRNGPVWNNALSGMDMALWDIKGKIAGLPLYQLLGGACRSGVAAYRHANGRDAHEVEDRVRAFQEQGYRFVRCQLNGYGGADVGVPPRGSAPGSYFDADAYAQSIPKLFEHLRSQLGFEIQLLHDVHERVAPIDAVRMAKALEPFRLFFLEDVLPPEQSAYFAMIRSQSACPLAMGELFNNPGEWQPLISQRLIDFIRVHLSQIGGITPARKLAALSEAFGVRTAWHGPGDVSPVGHAANVHLDLALTNFGVQEWSGISDPLREVFPGSPEDIDGYLYVNERPGLGIELDESKASLYPIQNRPPQWTLARNVDGTATYP